MNKTSFPLIAFLIFAVSLPAHADWGGTWTGKGRAVTEPGSAHAKTRTCQEISISFQETSGRLNLTGGGYACDDMEAEYGTAQFTIQNGKLVIAGQNYGDISPDKLDLIETDPDDGTLFHLTLKAGPDGSISYSEVWSQGSLIEMTVQGVLKR